jgi:hypothetical protein
MISSDPACHGDSPQREPLFKEQLESANEADYFVCRGRRRNSGFVVEKREAQAQDLIATVRWSIHFRPRPAHVALWRFSRDIQIRHYALAIFL